MRRRPNHTFAAIRLARWALAAALAATTPAVAPALELLDAPTMIGDGGGGPFASFTGLLDATLAHPTLGGSRLSVADGNTALPVDRVYLSYRHSHNALPVQIFQFRDDFDVDGYVLGGERTWADGVCSAELRLPLEYRMNSDFGSVVRETPGLNFPIVPGPPTEQAELGNVSLLLKCLLVERDEFALSGGVGVTLPTAKDATFSLALETTVDFPKHPGVSARTYNSINPADATGVISRFSNEAVHLSPFLAWLVAPGTSWFHQGFLQVDVAANPNTVTTEGEAWDVFLTPGVNYVEWRLLNPERINLRSQTMLRLNLGWGYVLHDDPRADWLRQAMGLFEVHYAATVQDARLATVPIEIQQSAGTLPFQTVQVGNVDNHVNVVNLVLGVRAQIAGFQVTNSVATPLRDGADRNFDFQYNLQIQRPF